MSGSTPPEPIVQVRSRRAASGGGRAGVRPRAERPRRQWPLLVSGVLAVLALAASAFLVLRPRQQVYVLRSYQAATVTRGTLIETATAVGTLASGDVRPVSAPTDAVVQEVRVRAGQDVKVGQSLVRLSSSALEANRVKARDTLLDVQSTQASSLRTAQSERTSAQIAQATATSLVSALEKALSGTEAVYALGGVARADLDGARQKVQDARRAAQAAANTLRAAESAMQDARVNGTRRVQAARDDLARAEQALQQLDVRAPIDGRVLNLTAQTGVRVGAGSDLLSVASLKEVSVQLQLSEALAGQVKAGQAARIFIGQQSWPGDITRVGSTASSSGAQAAPTVEAEVAFQTLPAGLRLGSSASVEVKVAEHGGVLILPREAFLSTGGEALAYVLGGERAERREVSYGAQNDTQVEVVSGLQVGERVITSSYEAFKDQPFIQAPPGGEIGQSDSRAPASGETP